MDAEKAIRAEIAAIEASPLMTRLRALNAALGTLTSTIAADMHRAEVRRRSTIDGYPASWQAAVGALGDQGLDVHEWRNRYNAIREKPIVAPSFDSQISKMKFAGLVHKRGGKWYPGRDVAAGTSERETPAAAHSNQEGGDGRDPATT